MSSLIAFPLILNIVLWPIFIFLYCYMRKNQKSFKKNIKQIHLLLIIFIGFAVYFIFFSPIDFVFDCQKETQRCDYYYSTIYNRELRLSKSYDLTDINEIQIVSHRYKRNKYSSITVFRLKFFGPFESFEMPVSFHSREKAEKQAAIVSRFLQTKFPRYTYKEITQKDEHHELPVFMILIFSLFMAKIGILIMLIKLFSNRK